VRDEPTIASYYDGLFVSASYGKLEPINFASHVSFTIKDEVTVTTGAPTDYYSFTLNSKSVVGGGYELSSFYFKIPPNTNRDYKIDATLGGTTTLTNFCGIKVGTRGDNFPCLKTNVSQTFTVATNKRTSVSTNIRICNVAG
jgi:hypothetical protein